MFVEYSTVRAADRSARAPAPRTRTPLEESLGALDVTLSPADASRIEEAAPASAVAGTRYDDRQMGALDSEPVEAGPCCRCLSSAPPSRRAVPLVARGLRAQS